MESFLKNLNEFAADFCRKDSVEVDAEQRGWKIREPSRTGSYFQEPSSLLHHHSPPSKYSPGSGR